MTLCGTCRRAIFSYETPSMLPGLPPDVEWTHYVRCDLADPDSGDHFAVPARPFLTRVLMCAVCRHPQRIDYHIEGERRQYSSVCSNKHCPGVDKD